MFGLPNFDQTEDRTTVDHLEEIEIVDFKFEKTEKTSSDWKYEYERLEKTHLDLLYKNNSKQ